MTRAPARPRIRLHTERFPARPVFDTAVSHSMLRRVAKGASPESLRLYRPDDVLLFSSLDARRPGYPRAVEIAAEHGFASAIRLAGGHAAAFLEESMAFAWALPDPDAHLHIHARFERLAGLVEAALRALGLDARIGELEGEYCPGEYSVHIAGRTKVMGVGQRVIRGGAHVGGVLTVGQTERMRAVLIPVYEALELDFRSETAGGIADFDASLGVEDVVDAFGAALEREGYQLEAADFEAATLRGAEALAAHHGPTRPAASRADAPRSLGGKTLLHADRLASSGPSESDDRSDDEDASR